MSAHEHLSDDVFIDGLYGLAEIDPGVRDCAVCASRWNQLRERRTAVIAPVEVGADVLAAQRSNIYRGIEHPSRMRWAAPAMAAATCLIAIGVFVHRPDVPARRAPAASVASDSAASDVAASDIASGISDTQLFSEVYSMEQSFEPSAAAPISALFDPGKPDDGKQ